MRCVCGDWGGVAERRFLGGGGGMSSLSLRRPVEGDEARLLSEGEVAVVCAAVMAAEDERADCRVDGMPHHSKAESASRLRWFTLWCGGAKHGLRCVVSAPCRCAGGVMRCGTIGRLLQWRCGSHLPVRLPWRQADLHGHGTVHALSRYAPRHCGTTAGT